MKARTILERRAAAAQATLDRFRDKPFEPGRWDCAQLVKFHVRQLNRPLKFGKALRYSTLLEGGRVLQRLGFATTGDALSSQFEQIAPASALVGDIVEGEGMVDADAGALGALSVYLGNGAVVGYHEDAVGAAVLRLVIPPRKAWRVL